MAALGHPRCRWRRKTDRACRDTLPVRGLLAGSRSVGERGRAGDKDLQDVVPLKVARSQSRKSGSRGAGSLCVHVGIRKMDSVVTTRVHDEPVLCIDETYAKLVRAAQGMRADGGHSRSLFHTA